MKFVQHFHCVWLTLFYFNDRNCLIFFLYSFKTCRAACRACILRPSQTRFVRICHHHLRPPIPTLPKFTTFRATTSATFSPRLPTAKSSTSRGLSMAAGTAAAANITAAAATVIPNADGWTPGRRRSSATQPPTDRCRPWHRPTRRLIGCRLR